ncbi:antitoxin Xre/MbcA/ParS toxin-binding domain-containing protein [Caballeronia mineralivorans]|jgi:putative toxin-antitoxin system antitoxin component (TIGR02293 family)|uniref:type II RES/Xre toxin-antitoxin system antitoxin n=1 Tax=Caballeronia mineralivorans TaxID=2010198 RepID=UPI0023F545E7|nr:antitoxin Xre/MbcA/ParS toxin-binding domain-containing protein [Caballeronia mineralivorans]MDB5786352.1 hypothetical protein [Caballeronia mineralivorans]MEA3097141.1 hypothetical protein [Caballeronia mineralivorans]
MESQVERVEGNTPFRRLLEALQSRIDTAIATPYRRAAAELDAFTVLNASVIRKVADMTPLQAHDIVTLGLPVTLAREMIDTYEFVGRDAVLQAIGISERTLQRGKDGDRLLDSNATDRLIRLASITERAIDVLGSKEAADQWLSAPAIGLDQRRPIDLLQSSEGADLVKTLLTRMDYGVYA